MRLLRLLVVLADLLSLMLRPSLPQLEQYKSREHWLLTALSVIIVINCCYDAPLVFVLAVLLLRFLGLAVPILPALLLVFAECRVLALLTIVLV